MSFWLRENVTQNTLAVSHATAAIPPWRGLERSITGIGVRRLLDVAERRAAPRECAAALEACGQVIQTANRYDRRATDLELACAACGKSGAGEISKGRFASSIGEDQLFDTSPALQLPIKPYRTPDL
jgi:hypothetical protein